MIDLISTEEKEIIEYYRRNFGYSNVSLNASAYYGNVSDFLYYWNENKGNLFKLLGNKLIYEEVVNIDNEDAAIEKCRDSSNWPAFLVNYINFCIKDYRTTPLYEHLRSFFQSYVISAKKYEGDTFKLDENITINSGMKYIKIMKLLNNKFQFATDEEYEEFRIWHSMLFNNVGEKERIYLSIHPLDYMTMSDNNEDWSSCMSWQEEGCYRRGTVEMMNSPYIIVAYVASESTKLKIGGNYWNSKRWRTLIYVDEDVITTVKSYPYQSDSLSKALVKVVKRLATENCGWSYEEDDELRSFDDTRNLMDSKIDNGSGCFRFSTNDMYNDFGTGVNHWYLLGTGHKLVDSYKNYSGEATCVYCGQTGQFPDEEDAQSLVCRDCSDYWYCERCDCIVRGSEDWYEVDGERICECCYENETVYTPIDGENHYEENVEEIYLAKVGEDGEVYLSEYAMKIYKEDAEYYMNKYFGKYDYDGTVNHNWCRRNYMLFENAIRDINDFFEHKVTNDTWFEDCFFIPVFKH